MINGSANSCKEKSKKASSAASTDSDNSGYFNGNSQRVYGQRIGKFEILTFSEVTRVLFQDDVSRSDIMQGLDSNYYGSSMDFSEEGFGAGLGGNLRADGSVSAQASDPNSAVDVNLAGQIDVNGGGGGGTNGKLRIYYLCFFSNENTIRI